MTDLAPSGLLYKEVFPELPFPAWKETCETLHLWTQIVGKVRLVQTPWLNHSWHVTLYLTARGLTTSPIPHPNGMRSFQIDFDFIDHRLLITVSDGATATLQLRPRSVADFYLEIVATLNQLNLPVTIHTTPNEMANGIPFEQDFTHTAYDPEYANRFWRILVQVDRIFKQFRTEFIGKCSPVHFFWGSFDLAVTRFSGRTAPSHPGGVPHFPDWVAREAYSHEVSSAGFWAGNDQFPEPLFYSYAYPEPVGFRDQPLSPVQAHYDDTLHEFVLPYNVVRTADSPDAVLLDFLQGSYEAAANTGKWDRHLLERKQREHSEREK